MYCIDYFKRSSYHFYIMSIVRYNGDPHTYRRSRAGKNYNCSCTSTEERPDGIYKCTFTKREDHLKKAIANGNVHTCKLQKEQFSKSLESYFVQSPQEEQKFAYEDILTKAAIFVGRKNLSIDAGSSKELQDLIVTAISYGLSNSGCTIKDIYKPFTPDVIRKYVISTANEIHQIQIRLFTNLTFVGLSIDEGSTRGIHDLDFVLESPLSGLSPYPFFTSVMNKGTAKDYTEHLARGLDLLRISRIPVGSITIDGNRAQLKALSFSWKDSLRNRYVDHNDYIKHILVNPCLCHRINNSYKSAYRNSEKLKEVVDNLRTLAKLCREHPADVLDVCPSVQLTRWLVDYDICCFILNHRQRIKKFSDFDEEAVFKLQKVLSVLKSLTNIFENTKTPHFRAFRLLENAVDALSDLEKDIPYAKIVKEELAKYTLNPADCGIWMLSYILTPAGRKDFNRRVNKKTLPPKPDYTSLFTCSKLKEKEDIEALIDASLESIEIPQKPEDYSDEINKILLPSSEKEDDDADENDDEYVPAFEEESELNEEEEEESELSEEEQSEHVQNVTEVKIPENPEKLTFYPAQKYLKQILINWGIGSKSQQHVMNAFNSFVSDKDKFKDQVLENGDYMWEHIKDLNPIWNTIAEIAARLHCSPCSEASCERTISTQRLVLTARRMSSKKELLDARLILMRGLNLD